MPTKLNKAGNQQNYVPAGNGDASGEYGDNVTGSNKHFTSFKKPQSNGGDIITSTLPEEQTSLKQEEIEETPQEETPQEEQEEQPPKETRWDELSKKQKKEIGFYVYSRLNYDNDRLIRDLRYYTGTFGDLSNFSKDDLNDIIDKVKSYGDKTEDFTYYKSGSKWEMTRNPKELLESMGIKTFTKEEREQEKENELESSLTNSKVQNKLFQELKDSGFKGAISLKGLNDKNSTDVVNSIKTTTKDFSFLNDCVVSFGTERGADALLEKEYRDFKETPEYEKEIEEYGKKLSSWNNGKEYSKDFIESAYKKMYLQENKRSSSGKSWGCCGATSKDSSKSWIQLRNTQYSKYELDNQLSVALRGYPGNIGASFGATTYHELGHAVCNYLLGKAIWGYQDTSTVSQIEEIKRKYNKPISGYGKTSTAEYIAECFASHYVDGTNEQANEVFNLIYNKWKGMKK